MKIRKLICLALCLGVFSSCTSWLHLDDQGPSKSPVDSLDVTIDRMESVCVQVVKVGDILPNELIARYPDETVTRTLTNDGMVPEPMLPVVHGDAMNDVKISLRLPGLIKHREWKVNNSVTIVQFNKKYDGQPSFPCVEVVILRSQHLAKK